MGATIEVGQHVTSWRSDFAILVRILLANSPQGFEADIMKGIASIGLPP
jgi:hypothetical protein